MIKIIPSIITSLNLFCGFLAILINDPIISPILILCATFFDVFDGMAARALNAVSPIGKELDSLADLVSFGVAPAYLYYNYILEPGYAYMAIAALIPVFSAVRLAIFNIDTEQSTIFKGLPTPANAVLFLSIPYIKNQYPEVFSYIDSQYILLALPILFSYLMISKIRMFSFKSMAQGIKTNPYPFIFILGSVGMLIFIKLAAMPFIIIWYVALSIIFTLTKAYSGKD